MEYRVTEKVQTMLNIKPPNYKFCPLCGTALAIKTEEGKERKYCPKDGWVYYPHVFASSCAILVKKGRVLLVKRDREPYKNLWMFPAGFVEYGELPEATLKREVLEETNLIVDSSKFITIMQSTDDPRAPGHFIFFYKVKAHGKLKSNDKTENNGLSWFDIQNPPEMGWLSHKKMMKKLQDRKI